MSAQEHGHVDARILLVTEVLAMLALAAFLGYYVWPVLGIAVVLVWAVVQRQLELARQERRLAVRATARQGTSRFADPDEATRETAVRPVTPRAYDAGTGTRE